MKIKNVLTIAPYPFLPANTGGQKAIFFLYQHLGKVVNLTVLSTKNNMVEAESGLNFSVQAQLNNSAFRYFNPVTVQKCRKLILENKIDTLMLEHPYMGFWGWVIKTITGKRLVIRSHNIEALRFKELGKWWWKLLWYYEKWVHRRADFSFFITAEDRSYAEKHYGLPFSKSMVVTYGMDRLSPITVSEKQQQTAAFKTSFKIDQSKTLLLFNGIFGYGPNDQALNCLLERILPELTSRDPDIFLVVCGKNIPTALEDKRTNHMLILGFVPDINILFTAAEIFLNPIWLGGGIKTKLVEALAAGSAAVSFSSGAIGVDPELLAGKLSIVKDLDIVGFAAAVIEQKSMSQLPTPDSFFEYFNWDHIAAQAAKML